MKKTIAALALTASSSSAFALYAPAAESKTYCLSVYQSETGASYAGTCDQTANNLESKTPVLENGCAVAQIALEASKFQGQKDFNIKIFPCLPPNVAQL